MAEKTQDDFKRFVKRLIEISIRTEGTIGNLHKVDDEVLARFFLRSEHLEDDQLSLAFDVLVQHTVSFMRPAMTDDEDATARNARFIDSLVIIVPLFERFNHPHMPRNVRIAKISRMSEIIAASRIGLGDYQVVLGYVLEYALGYDSIPDGIVDELRWRGQHFDLIVSHWGLFQERGIFDREFILQLAAHDGAKPLSNGVL